LEIHTRVQNPTKNQRMASKSALINLASTSSFNVEGHERRCTHIREAVKSSADPNFPY
jgi:hypothetical protein